VNKTVLVLIISCTLVTCSDPETPTRSYRMGFMNSGPRFDDIDLVLQSLALWTQRADAAIINTEVPWDSLLDGKPVVDYVINHYRGLTQFYRSKNFELWVYIDPQNGLDRTADAVALQNRGRSIAEQELQQLYKRFVVVMDSVLQPEHVGLGLETNLIRDASSTAIYQCVKQAVNETAAELINRNTQAKLSISVQVDHAWGKLSGGTYTGIEQDFIDFPFMEELGLSSYPYLGFDDPTDIPGNYYTRLTEGHNLPVFVSEGGYASTTVANAFTSSPQLQKKYMEHHHTLLKKAKAIALFQLVFTDIDISSVPDPIPPNLHYFISIGLVDVNLNPKPALEAWDKQFKRERIN
jgi:hypothetical protein